MGTLDDGTNLGNDPLFVRDPDAGPNGNWDGVDDDYGDLSLSPGSPCIDSGSNAAVPPDTADVDGDGDTAEPMPFDLGGNSRFLDNPDSADCPQPGSDCGTPPIVDMGAYEFQGAAIPTMSEWGMVAMTLLVLAAGTVVLRRRLRP